MKEILEIENFKFEIRWSTRRKTFGLTVDRSGELIAHAPANSDINDLHKWIRRKLLWVNQKLLRKAAYKHETNHLEIVSGECIPYLGQNYRLKIVKQQPCPLQFNGTWFLLREENRLEAPRCFQQWYQTVGIHWLNERVQFWGPKTGTSVQKITVRELGFRWGSCSKSGVIHFNWRLLQLSVRLIDYVIAHELVHLSEHLHSPLFWRIIDRVLPDWEQRKEELSHKRAEMNWHIGNGGPKVIVGKL